MKFFVLICASFFAGSVFAADGNVRLMSDNTNSASYFQQIQDLFAKGTLPTQAEVTGMWSGRCYRDRSPSSAYAALLIARNVSQTPPDVNGPLFPKPVTTVSFNIGQATRGYETDEANRYDVLTPDDKISFEELIKTDAFKSLVSSVDNGSIMTSTDDIKFYVRKMDRYFLALTIAAHDSDVQKAGDVGIACYYFKKVSN